MGPVLLARNRLAVVEPVGVLVVGTGPWHSHRGSGGVGGKCCVGLNLVSGKMERKTNHDTSCGCRLLALLIVVGPHSRHLCCG